MAIVRGSGSRTVALADPNRAKWAVPQGTFPTARLFISEVVEQFFEGQTRSGRALVLCFEPSAEDPTEPRFAGTLDGEPIEVYGVRWSASKGTATVRSDQGTFTASESEYEEDHSEALRDYLEHRPSDGWEVAIVGSEEIGEESSYTVTITNGRLTERAEFRLSPQVKETLAGEGAAGTEKAVCRQIAATIRGDTWAKIKERADTPTSLVWLAHPD